VTPPSTKQLEHLVIVVNRMRPDAIFEMPTRLDY
jgi:hypothetical protein